MQRLNSYDFENGDHHMLNSTATELERETWKIPLNWIRAVVLC